MRNNLKLNLHLYSIQKKSRPTFYFFGLIFFAILFTFSMACDSVLCSTLRLVIVAFFLFCLGFFVDAIISRKRIFDILRFAQMTDSEICIVRKNLSREYEKISESQHIREFYHYELSVDDRVFMVCQKKETLDSLIEQKKVDIYKPQKTSDVWPFFLVYLMALLTISFLDIWGWYSSVVFMAIAGSFVFRTIRADAFRKIIFSYYASGNGQLVELKKKNDPSTWTVFPIVDREINNLNPEGIRATDAIMILNPNKYKNALFQEWMKQNIIKP